ncbi:TPA: hypothetical protein QCU60_004324 [Bacillus cereus]|nr:hypothetical protein [Bacillus cereus]HDR6312338.1 hypothetical protein [Bacillus cereus]
MNQAAMPKLNLQSVFYHVRKEELKKWMNELSKEIEHGVCFDKYLKRELMDALEDLYADETYHEIIHERILNEFPKSCGVGPTNVETILDCTKAERKRWQEEGKLKIADYFETHSRYGIQKIPMFNRRQLETLTEEDIQVWRNEWEEEKELKRELKDEYEKKEKIYLVLQAVKAMRKEIIKGPFAVYGDENIHNVVNEFIEEVKKEIENNFYVIVKSYQQDGVFFIEKID